MKQAKEILFILIPGLFLFYFLRRTPPGIGVQEALKLTQDPATTILDVRTPAEFSEEHIAGAILNPVS